MNLKAMNQVLADQPAYRIMQIKKDLFERLITNWAEATTLPQHLRRELALKCPLNITAKTLVSKNGQTIKALITLEDDLNIEAVLMRYPTRNTVCVSTQVGCPIGCVFCATGKMGLKRNLTVDEIVSQVVFFGRYLKSFGERVTRVVMMGMGEPFLNFDNLVQAIKVLSDPHGSAIGARKISVSTVGLSNKIRAFADIDRQTNLALSLHAPTDELRAKLIPVHTSLREIIAALDYYLSKTKRKVMIEYVLLAGVNDSQEQAIQLAKLLGKRMVMVNLIRYNPTFIRGVHPRGAHSSFALTSFGRTRPVTPGVGSNKHLGGDSIGFSEVGEIFRPSTQKTIERFKDILEEAGIEVTQRYSFGTDIGAACGQLAGKRFQNHNY